MMRRARDIAATLSDAGRPGRDTKLLVDGPDATQADPALIRLLIRAHELKSKLLLSGDASLTDTAHTEETVQNLGVNKLATRGQDIHQAAGIVLPRWRIACSPPGSGRSRWQSPPVHGPWTDTLRPRATLTRPIRRAGNPRHRRYPARPGLGFSDTPAALVPASSARRSRAASLCRCLSEAGASAPVSRQAPLPCCPAPAASPTFPSRLRPRPDPTYTNGLTH
jgi:hypothetical protein